MTSRDAVLAILPHGLVAGARDRRMLRRLGATTLTPRAAGRVREAHLDLLPDGALPQLDVVVDAGANEGRWSEAVAAVARPRHLIAVEPSPELLTDLRRRLGEGATIVEAALGSSVGEATLNVTAHSHNTSVRVPRTDEMNALYGAGYELKSQIRVTTTTLDEVTRGLDEISLLKIDVQGSERDVLAGAAETLRKTRWLLIEVTFRSHYEGDLLFPGLHELLNGSGFVLSGIASPRVHNEVALWSDALYTRQS